MSSDACPVYNLSRQLSALLCSVDFAELFSGVVEPSIETNSAPGPPAPQIFKSLSALVRMLRDPHQLAMSLVKTHGDAIRSDRVVLAQFSTFLNCFKAAEICLSGILSECAKQAVGPSGNALTHLPSSSPGPSAYHQPTAQLLTSGSNNSQNAIARFQDPAKQVNLDRPSNKLKTHAETSSFDTCSAAADIESSSPVSFSKDRSLSLHRSEDVADSQGDEMEKIGSPSQEHGADIRVRKLARSNSCIIRAERAAKAAERRREATISSTSKYSAVAPLPHISSTPVAASSVDSRPPSTPSASSPVEGMRKFSMVETIEMIRSIAQNVVWANEEQENLRRALSESLQQPQPSGALDSANSNSVVSHAPDEATTDENEEESINPLRPGGCPGWRIYHLDHCPYEFRVGPAKRPVGKEALMRPSSPSEVHSPPSTSETSSAPPANKGKKRAREEDESDCQHPAQRSRKGTVNDPQNLLDSESETNAESIVITNFPTSPSRKRSHSPVGGEEPRSGGLTKRRKGA